MWFEGTCCAVGWRVKSECNRFGMLQGCVEGIAEEQEECIAVPSELVFYGRVGEPCTVKEVGCHYPY